MCWKMRGSGPARIDYIPINPSPAKKPMGWEPCGWKRAAALISAALLLVAVISGTAVKNRWDGDHAASSVNPRSARMPGGSGQGTVREPEAAGRTEAGKEEEKAGGNRKKQLLHAQDLCYNIVRYKNDSI